MLKTKIKNLFRNFKLDINKFKILENFLYKIIKKFGTTFLLILFLFYANVIPFGYYKIKQNYYQKNINHNEKVINNYKIKLQEDKTKLNCINNQLKRLVNDEVVKLGYCN